MVNLPSIRAALAALLLLAAPSAALAHTQSYGFVSLDVAGHAVQGRVELAVRDLDADLGLDSDADGQVTWGELRIRETDVREALAAGVTLDRDGTPCALAADPLMISTRAGESYVLAPLGGRCEAGGGDVAIGYDLRFDADQLHRGLVAATVDGRTSSLVMTPETRHATVSAGEGGLFATVADFVVHGIHHIWIGYDHILFVVTLVLGAAVVREGGRWLPAAGFRPAVVETAKLVTAFTVAHSVTLILAATGAVSLPTALVEAAIAATLVIAAVNTVVPVITRRIWLLAFGFGLIHGFGFANVLAELALPAGGMVAALLAFNVGVEIGQLAIVAVVLPAVILLGRTAFYPRVALPALSASIAVVGLLWFVGRVSGVDILPIG